MVLVAAGLGNAGKLEVNCRFRWWATSVPVQPIQSPGPERGVKEVVSGANALVCADLATVGKWTPSCEVATTSWRAREVQFSTTVCPARSARWGPALLLKAESTVFVPGTSRVPVKVMGRMLSEWPALVPVHARNMVEPLCMTAGAAMLFSRESVSLIGLAP